MTNMEIILGECLLHGIDEPVDTFAGWKRKGMCVKKGEHSAFSTRIWKPKYGKNEEGQEDEETQKMDHMILVKAHFFKKSQVEKEEVK